MTVRRFGVGVYWGLKTATRNLLCALGGAEAAACGSRSGRSLWGDYGNPNSPRFPPIDVVLDAEAECGRPFVTETLARLHGYLLVPIVPRGEGEVREQLARFAESAGGVMSEGYRALADDVITPEEGARLVKQLHEIGTVVNDTIALLERRKA